MSRTSEYPFPIFISSTDYNLRDLRSELSRFLGELGYRPILSSSEGFPDNTPKLEPWESCLPVLDTCFVMILVIDGRYGNGLPWPNFKQLFDKRKVSPTHGEYLFRHAQNKRMLVFIRDEVLTYYQSYRKATENVKNEEDEVKAKQSLEKVLPDQIDYETLKFINEVKTTKPIPWIKSFSDVTQIKKEVQKKMLNELAEVFMIKEKKLETVVAAFNQVMDELTPEKQKEILNKINATKDLTEAKEDLKQKEAELQATKKELESTKEGQEKSDEEKEQKVSELKKEIKNLKKKIESEESKSLGLDSSGLRLGGGWLANLGTGLYGTASLPSTSPFSSSLYTKPCDKCGNPIEGGFLSAINRHCNSCGRDLCQTCWSDSGTLTLTGSKCPDCRSSPTIGGIAIAE